MTTLEIIRYNAFNYYSLSFLPPNKDYIFPTPPFLIPRMFNYPPPLHISSLL